MNYLRSSLNPAVQRYIKSKERYLGRKCGKIWSATNPLGEKFLYGKFCIDYDEVIVSIAIENINVSGRWLPLWHG